MSLRDRWALEKAARCLDCNSRTHLTEPTPGVYLLEVRHDDTCPTTAACKGTAMPDHDAPLLFDCPRCHAVPGQRCTGSSRAVQYSHQPRQDRYIRATRRAMTREESKR